MKSKKHLGIVSAVLGICLSVSSFTAFSALADDSTPTTTIVYEGNTDANKNTDRVFFANPISDHFTVKKDETESTFDYKKIKEGTVKVLDAEGNDLPNDTDVKFEYDKDNGTLKINKAGTYTISAEFTDATTEGPVTSVIEVVDKAILTLSTDAAKVAEIEEKVQSEVDGLDEDEDSFDSPAALWDLIGSNVYEAKAAKQILVKLYVAKPGSSFSAVNSSFKNEFPDIEVSSSGIYEFYFEVMDPDGNEILKETDYIQKIDGWYSVDDNGTPDDEDDDIETLVLPIFKFEYKNEAKLKLEDPTGGSTAGIVGQEYTSVKFTSNGVDNIVKLEYSANGTSGWREATSEEATYGTLSINNTNFTPLKKGYFRLVLQARGGADGFETGTKYSKVINVNREIQQQKLVNVKFRNFMKNNWLSVVFLGIAFLCIIGIIILALYKPKDEVTTKKDNKVEDENEAVEEATEEEEVTEAEEVEEAEQEVEGEESEETETAEENVETAEEATETSTEETTAEETEEVKNDGENA